MSPGKYISRCLLNKITCINIYYIRWITLNRPLYQKNDISRFFYFQRTPTSETFYKQNIIHTRYDDCSTETALVTLYVIFYIKNIENTLYRLYVRYCTRTVICHAQVMKFNAKGSFEWFELSKSILYIDLFRAEGCWS